MYEYEMLKDWLHDDEIELRDKLLLCLAADRYVEKDSPTVVRIFQEAGFRLPQSVCNPFLSETSNCQQLLPVMTHGVAVCVSGCWKLNKKGIAYVKQLVAKLQNEPAAVAASTLRDVLVGIQNENIRGFVEEAIQNFEHGA